MIVANIATFYRSINKIYPVFYTFWIKMTQSTVIQQIPKQKLKPLKKIQKIEKFGQIVLERTKIEPSN